MRIESIDDPSHHQARFLITEESVTPMDQSKKTSLPTDSSSRILDLLHQLQVLCGATRDDPISVLMTSIAYIDQLKAKCAALERRLQDTTLCCTEAQSRAQQSELQYQRCQEIIQSLTSSSSFEPSTHASPPRLHTPPFMLDEQHSNHVPCVQTDPPLSQQLTNHLSVQAGSHVDDSPLVLSPLLIAASPRNKAISAIIDRRGNVIQCSTTFAELFGYNYFRSRSSPGVYNLFVLTPSSVDQISSLLDQAFNTDVYPLTPLTCILVVEGWHKISTVIMSVRPASADESADSPNHEMLFWASFEIVGTTESATHHSEGANQSRSPA